MHLLSGDNAEMTLPADSSFMPSKVNPVRPELINQMAYRVCGNDVAMAEAIPIFARRCIKGIAFGDRTGAKVAKLAEKENLSIEEATVRLETLPRSLAEELPDPMTLTDAAKSAEVMRRVMA
uniref:Lyase n=1 Tax=Candidatus Kentrum sp. TUN TaxID=2126343 RepID=A0A451A8E2_9GAMM|nr:MAG: Lyase [Candidatus Kentron sp. TUN]VFK71821.1 MAG: Lyase [Candidatus Kentron sp. TUN]